MAAVYLQRQKTGNTLMAAVYLQRQKDRQHFDGRSLPTAAESESNEEASISVWDRLLKGIHKYRYDFYRS